MALRKGKSQMQHAQRRRKRESQEGKAMLQTLWGASGQKGVEERIVKREGRVKENQHG